MSFIFIGQSALLTNFARGNSNAHLFDSYGALKDMFCVWYNELCIFIFGSNNDLVSGIAHIIEAANIADVQDD